MAESPQISPSHAEDNKRIAKNTLMLYGRMLFSMLVSLYTSRVVLNTLGVEDYGIYNVVGGFVAMFSLISGSLSASVGRFITFELGKGDIEKLKRIFSTSILIHLALAAVVFILAETVGVWFLYNKMTIPPERLTAAMWVFQASIVNFLFGLWSVPYNATIIAHEHMKAFAWFGIFDVVMRLAIVLFIAFSPWMFDRLIAYAVLLTLLALAMRIIYARYCHRHFEESQWSFSFDKQYWKELGSFAGWNFIGSASIVLKTQGVNVLYNLFGGPVWNAARGIATTVNTAVISFVGNFMTALNPQITKSYAAQDYSYAIQMVNRGSKFSFFILFLITLPILLNTEFILTIWLTNFPDHTVNFVRLILISALIEVLSGPLITLLAATGNIRDYQIVVGVTQLLNFPISYVFLHLGAKPESTFIIAIILSLCCIAQRLWFLKKMVRFSIRVYAQEVVSKIVLASIVALVATYAVCYFLPIGGILLFLSSSIIAVVFSSIAIYLLGCSQDERTYIIELLYKFRVAITKRIRYNV